MHPCPVKISVGKKAEKRQYCGRYEKPGNRYRRERDSQTHIQQRTRSLRKRLRREDALYCAHRPISIERGMNCRAKEHDNTEQLVKGNPRRIRQKCHREQNAQSKTYDRLRHAKSPMPFSREPKDPATTRQAQVSTRSNSRPKACGTQRTMIPTHGNHLKRSPFRDRRARKFHREQEPGYSRGTPPKRTLRPDKPSQPVWPGEPQR